MLLFFLSFFRKIYSYILTRHGNLAIELRFLHFLLQCPSPGIGMWVQGLGPEGGTDPRSSRNDTLFAPTVVFMSPKGLSAPRVSLVLKIESTRMMITAFAAALEWVFLPTNMFEKERVLTRDICKALLKKKWVHIDREWIICTDEVKLSRKRGCNYINIYYLN